VIKGANLHPAYLQEKTVNLNSEVLGYMHYTTPEPSQEIDSKSYNPFDKVVLIKDIDN
jgi:hypothetical protein